MPKPAFLAKPDAPSVRTTIGAAIANGRTLAHDAPRTRHQVVRDILATLQLPPSLGADLRRRNGLDAEDGDDSADD